MGEVNDSDWYYTHDGQRSDILRGAQNAADVGGGKQTIWRTPASNETATHQAHGRAWVLDCVVEPNLEHARAGTGKARWEA